MSFIRKTPAGTWGVHWREAGKVRQKNFKTRAEAKHFEVILNTDQSKKSGHISLETLLLEYRDVEIPKKKTQKTYLVKVSGLCKRPISKLKLSEITRDVLQEYFEERMLERTGRTGGLITAGTVRREHTFLSSVFNYAIKKKLLSENPCKGIELPREADHRERIASEEEIEKLMTVSGWDGKSVPTNQYQLTMAAFLFSRWTGMRAGEILAIEQAWIDQNGYVLHIPAEATKTSHKRDIALCSEARRILALVAQCRPPYFSDLNSEQRSQIWLTIRDRAGLAPVIDSKGRQVKEGLNFHDARATFATWAASPDPKTGAPRLDILSLAKQTGHKSISMLQRYYRASAEDIAKRLG